VAARRAPPPWQTAEKKAGPPDADGRGVWKARYNFLGCKAIGVKGPRGRSAQTTGRTPPRPPLICPPVSSTKDAGARVHCRQWQLVPCGRAAHICTRLARAEGNSRVRAGRPAQLLTPRGACSRALQREGETERQLAWEALSAPKTERDKKQRGIPLALFPRKGIESADRETCGRAIWIDD
jgi:hypothetical protein